MERKHYSAWRRFYNNPGNYNLLNKNCDGMTEYIVQSAGLHYYSYLQPNQSFHSAKNYEMLQNIIKESGIVAK